MFPMRAPLSLWPAMRHLLSFRLWASARKVVSRKDVPTTCMLNFDVRIHTPTP